VDKEVEGNEGVARNDALDIVVVDKSVKKVRNPNAVKHVEKASGQVSERPKKLSEKPKNSEHVIVSSTQVTPKKDERGRPTKRSRRRPRLLPEGGVIFGDSNFSIPTGKRVEEGRTHTKQVKVKVDNRREEKES
jgi:hypothetical protein